MIISLGSQRNLSLTTYSSLIYLYLLDILISRMDNGQPTYVDVFLESFKDVILFQ